MRVFPAEQPEGLPVRGDPGPDGQGAFVVPAEGEEKLFKVISPGWRHGDSGAVISKSEIIAVLGHEGDDVSDH